MPRTRRLIALAIAVASSVPLAAAPTTWAGDGGFAAGQNLNSPQPASLAVGDFNNDGRPDLAVAGGPGRSVEILLQQRDTGGLAPGPAVPINGLPQLIAVGDFNRDGNDDLAIGDNADQKVKVRLGEGDGRFPTAAPDVDVKGQIKSLVIGDFDGDGREDLAAGTRRPNGAPHPIAVRLGEGDGRFPRGDDVGDGAAVLAVADFNSDAIQDLAFGGQANYPNGNLLLGKGGAGFAPRADVPLPQSLGGRHALAVADFNNDRKPDLVAALGKDLTAVRLGGGDGGFTQGTEVLTPGTPSAVAVGDFNSDGNDDFAVSDTSGSKLVRVRLGDGAGKFTAAADVTVGSNPVDIAVADYDSDGNDDLAVANADGTVSVRPGTGPAPLAGNLLVNGGFEGPTPTGHIRPPFSIEGWQLDGGISAARYGSPSSADFPGRIASPRYNGGGRMLAGGTSTGTNGITGVNQLVDVSRSAAEVDASRSTANLSAYLGGALQYEDAASVQAEFLNGNNSLGSFQIGPVTAADRNKQTTLLRRAESRAVPAGTRQIRIRVISTDADKTESSALADNVKLMLSTAPAKDGGTTTPPPPPRDRFGSKTLVTLKPTTRVKPRQAVRVAVRNGNGFAVTGKLAKRRLSVGARSSSTVKVKLSGTQRRTLQRKRSVTVRLTASVTDPAGETRRVTRTVRLRSKR